jgi:hypothetical protein
VCVRVFIGVSAHTCMIICVCTVFLKNEYLKSGFTRREGPSVDSYVKINI